MPAIIDNPVFIIGNPRSGTTLLRLMVSSHSKISIPPECGFLVWWHIKYKDWTKEDSANDVRVDEYISDLRTSKKIETWDLDYLDLKSLIKNELPENYAELSSLVYYSYSLTRNKNISVWGDKNNYYIAHLEELSDIYPNARFIHIIRDGRDVACSYLNLARLDSASPYKPKLSDQLAEIAKEWSDNNLKIKSFTDKLNTSNRKLVKYEDIIENPEESLMFLCKFLDLQYEPEMIHFHKTEREPLAFLDWKKKTMEKADPTNKNIYLTILTPQEIDLFNQNAIHILNLYGYTI